MILSKRCFFHRIIESAAIVQHMVIAKNNHHMLLDIDVTKRTVVYFDGMDPAISLGKTVSSGHRHELLQLPKKEETVADTLSYIELLFDVLHMHIFSKTGDQLGLQFIKTYNMLRSSELCDKHDSWQVISAVLFYEDWEDYLIQQNNNFSCGPITILQLMKLLGVSIDPRTLSGNPNTNFARHVLSLFIQPRVMAELFVQYMDDCLALAVEDHTRDLWANLLSQLKDEHDTKRKEQPIRDSDELPDVKRAKLNDITEVDNIPDDSMTDKHNRSADDQPLVNPGVGDAKNPIDLLGIQDDAADSMADVNTDIGHATEPEKPMRDGQQAAEDDVNDNSEEDDDHEADGDDRVAEDDVNDADDDSEADDDHEDDDDDRQPITEPDENQTEASAPGWILLGQSNEETMNDLSGLLITIDYPPLQEEKTNESKPKLLKRWSNWRFPNVDWTQGLNHFRTHISGLPNDYSIMEMPDYFPLISYVRVSTDDKNNIRWHFRYPGLPGKKSEDYNSNEVTREFIDFCFIPTFVERALNEVDRWVRVLFIDYDLDQDYEGMSAVLRSQYFLGGKTIHVETTATPSFYIHRLVNKRDYSSL